MAAGPAGRAGGGRNGRSPLPCEFAVARRADPLRVSHHGPGHAGLLRLRLLYLEDDPPGAPDTRADPAVFVSSVRADLRGERRPRAWSDGGALFAARLAARAAPGLARLPGAPDS